MTDDDDKIVSLRLALADAERARDEALAEAAAIQQRWQDDRHEEQHRFRNVFSVIRAIAHRTGDDVETVEDYCGVLDGRLSAYLKTQASVMQDWVGGADLALLLAATLQPFGLKEGERVDLDGPPVRLRSQAAGILALAFHELAFGVVMSDRVEAPGNRLEVRWHLHRRDPKQALLLDWVELVPASNREEEAPSSWADWVEQAIQYQLAGSLSTELGTLKRTTRVCLPNSAIC